MIGGKLTSRWSLGTAAPMACPPGNGRRLERACWPAEGTLGPGPWQARRPGQDALTQKVMKGGGRKGAGDRAARPPRGDSALVPRVNSPSLRPADGGARGRGPSPPSL